MKYKYFVIGFLLVFVVTISSYSFYTNSGFKGRLELEKQLNGLISSKDETKLKAISNDKDTLSFLNNLPVNTKCYNTSDPQGLSPDGIYFVTIIKNYRIDVYMKEDTGSFFHKIFPKWSINLVSKGSSF